MIIGSSQIPPAMPPRMSPRLSSDSASTTSSFTESTELPDYASMEGASYPPHYQSYSRPSVPVIYSFSEWEPSTNTMYLNPPGSEDPFASDAPAPLYKITVSINLDPMLPISYTTRLHRYGAPGPPIGSFEVSLAQKRRIVTFGDASARLDNVLESMGAQRWQWTIRGVRLRWDCRTRLDDGSPMCYCHISHPPNHDVQLASFVPPPSLESPPLPLATLTVFPDGHQYLDHIVLSALVVVRQMTAGL
ncbi:hypothetical protein EV715DRAFT_252960 [Schizophyllum commune]